MDFLPSGVAQEHTMGCGVACVAYRCGISYVDALKSFSAPEHAWTRGFYCPEMVEALERLGQSYSFARYNSHEHQKWLSVPGTIVFVDPCDEYPSGHFLVRHSQGWMNPWSSYPKMIPVEAAIQATLPGEVGYVIFESPAELGELSRPR